MTHNCSKWMGWMILILLLNTGQITRAELKFIPIVDASLSLNSARYDAEYAANQTDSEGNPIPSNAESTAQNIYLYFSPNLGLTELPGLWLTPMLEYEYQGANNILNLEDESFVYNKRMDFYYLLGINYDLDKMWSFKLKGFGRLEKVQETADENLNNGLYNYNDLGGWGEVSASYRLGLPMRTKLGYKGYSRRYPFYTNQEFVEEYESTVGSWPAGLPRDLHEKDINVGELWLRQELSWNGIPLLTNLEARLKSVQYTEMPAILSDGTFSDTKRQDGYIDVSLEVPFLLNQYHQLEFDYAYRLRGSNQAVFDTDEPEPLYLDGYYNYYQNNVRLLYNFKFAFTITDFSPQGSVGLAWQHRQYLSRPSRQKQNANDTVGIYVFDEPHWENNFDFGLTLRQQLFAQWFNVFLSFHAISQTSNTNVEDAASYNYKYNTFTLGMAISF